MNFNLSDIPILYVILVIIILPVAIGFLMAAGQDLYKAIRKQDISGKCGEHIMMIRDVSEMKEAQKILRQVRLPGIETQLALIAASQLRTETKIQNLFDKWDAIYSK